MNIRYFEPGTSIAYPQKRGNQYFCRAAWHARRRVSLVRPFALLFSSIRCGRKGNNVFHHKRIVNRNTKPEGPLPHEPFSIRIVPCGRYQNVTNGMTDAQEKA